VTEQGADLETVEDGEERGGEDGQCDEKPGDVGAPIRQQRSADGSTYFRVARFSVSDSGGARHRLAEEV